MNKILNNAYELVDSYNISHDLVDYLYNYIKNNNLPLSVFDEYILKLIKGIPVQYIVGDVDFCGNIIKVNNNVLIPRFETELLVDKTIKLAKNIFSNKISILDIGTGSGCIAITLAKNLNSDVTAVDISLEALLVARENAKNNCVDIKFIHSDMFANVKDKYNIIISNPPYIAEDEEIMDIVKKNEPEIALYAMDNGLYYYDIILKNCLNYVKEKFLIAFEIGCQQKDDIINIANKYLNNIDIWCEKDYNNKDRFIFIKSKEL